MSSNSCGALAVGLYSLEVELSCKAKLEVLQEPARRLGPWGVAGARMNTATYSRQFAAPFNDVPLRTMLAASSRHQPGGAATRAFNFVPAPPAETDNRLRLCCLEASQAL